MTGRGFKNILYGVITSVVILVILQVTGLLDAPFIDALPWAIALGIILGLLFRFIEEYFHRRTSKRQDTP